MLEMEILLPNSIKTELIPFNEMGVSGKDG